MPLPTSGQISISQVNVELGAAANTQRNIGQGFVRALANRMTGTIAMSNLRGTAVQSLTTPNTPTPILGLVNQTAPWTGGNLIGNWPDASAQWIWNTPSAAVDAPAGVNVFMQALYTNNTQTTQTGVVFCGIDNSGELFVNDVSVGTIPSWTPATSFNVTLLPGVNKIVVRGVNAGGPAGMVFTMSVGGTVVLRSGSGWSFY